MSINDQGGVEADREQLKGRDDPHHGSQVFYDVATLMLRGFIAGQLDDLPVLAAEMSV